MTIEGFGGIYIYGAMSYYGSTFVPFIGITNIFVYIGNIIFDGLLLSQYNKERNLYFASYRIYTFVVAVSG